MKRDQYIPHDVSMRSNTEIMHLIEEQGMTGYGIYWALMEYLRTQDNYIGDLRVLRNLSRQIKARLPKVLSILHDYNLFICNDYTFYSPKLGETMKPLEEKRKKIEAYKRKKVLDNLLEINKTNEAVSNLEGKGKGKGEGEGKGKGKENSSSAEEECRAAAEAVDSLSKKLAWEEYVDELDGDESWKELMAMRSGMKQQFFTLYPRIVKSFKNHVRCMGKEHHILSLGDAKRYFCFFVNPGSATYIRLLDELKQQEDDDPYRFEYRDKETGKRMYCGLVIPDEAPPRPSEQAVWNPEKKIWFY